MILLGASQICLDVNCGVAREGAEEVTGGHGTAEEGSGTDVLDSRAPVGLPGVEADDSACRPVPCGAGRGGKERSADKGRLAETVTRRAAQQHKSGDPQTAPTALIAMP